MSEAVTHLIAFLLGFGVTLALWDVMRMFIAARRFNEAALERIAKLEAASLVHEDKLDGLHSKLGAQQAANNQARMRGLR